MDARDQVRKGSDLARVGLRPDGQAGPGAPGGASLGRGPAGLWRDQRGQGTTEYAILVGVLVVIAIIAIVAFRDRVTQLWQAISDGINSL